MKNNFLTIIASIFLAAPSASFAEGTIIGNGGDVIKCGPVDGTPVNGLTSLDYILTWAPLNSDLYKDIQVTSFKNSLDQVESVIQKNYPEFMVSWADFRKNLFNTQHFLENRIWEPAPFGLVDLKDEEIVALVPKECLTDGEVKVIQAVVRQNPNFSGTSDDTIFYKYIPSIVDHLEEYSPLQLSYLVVHEWLWDLSKNVDRNRRFNRFLHSEAPKNLSIEDNRKYASKLGFTLSGGPLPPPLQFQDLNWDFKCPADLQGYKDLLVDLYQGYHFSKIGTFKVFERTTKCFLNGCDAPGQPKEVPEFKEDLEEESRLNIRHSLPQDILIMRARKTGGPQDTLANCRLDKTGVSRFTCGSLMNPNPPGPDYYNPLGALFFNPFENPDPEWLNEIRFQGVVGKSCLRFYQVGQTPVQNSPQGKFYMKVEMLLVSTISEKND